MEIQELSDLAQEARKKKGRMDAVARDEAAELVHRIWNSESLDPTGSFESMNEIQSEAVAEGIGKAWSRMGEARREVFLSWLPAATSDRASRRISLIAVAIMDADPKTATNLLCRLLPTGRRNMSKDLRQMLRSTLFGDTNINFEKLGEPGIPVEQLIRTLVAIVDISFDPASNISPVVRSRIALTIRRSLKSLRDYDSDRTTQLESQIAVETKRWPQALQEQFQRLSESTEPRGLATTLTEAPRPSSTAIPADRAAEPACVDVDADTLTPFSTLEEHLDKRLAAISSEVEMLNQLGTLLADLKKRYLELQAEAESIKVQAARSTEQARQAFEITHSLENQLEEQKSKVMELNIELQK